MVMGLGQNLETQEKNIILVEYNEYCISMLIHNTIVNVGIMLTCLSWILAFYLTPVTKVGVHLCQ